MARFLPILLALVIFGAGFYGGYRYHDSEIVAANPAGASAPAGIAPASQDPDIVISDEQKRLRDKLLRASREITDLEARNQALARQIEQMDLPLPSSTTYAELLQRVERLPASLVNQQLKLIFDEEYLENVEDPNEFAKELIEVALSEEEPEAEVQVQVEFALSPVRGVRQFSSLQQLDRNDSIFAHFTSSMVLNNLIVRWQHRNTGEILQFGPLRLSDGRSNYLAMKPQNGWRTGQYQVSVFNFDDARRQIGAGSYQIASITSDSEQANDSQADQDVIEDLISTGQALPKSF